MGQDLKTLPHGFFRLHRHCHGMEDGLMFAVTAIGGGIVFSGYKGIRVSWIADARFQYNQFSVERESIDRCRYYYDATFHGGTA